MASNSVETALLPPGHVVFTIPHPTRDASTSPQCRACPAGSHTRDGNRGRVTGLFLLLHLLLAQIFHSSPKIGEQATSFTVL